MSKSIIIFDVIFFITLAITVFFVGELLYEKKKFDKIFGFAEAFRKRKKEKSKKIKIQLLKKLHNNLKNLLEEKEKGEKVDLYFNIIGVFILVFTLFLLFEGQVLLAIMSPFIIILFINKIINLSRDNIHERLERQLPLAIDNIIRISTKYNDMRTIIYETAQTLNDPLKGIFIEMAIQMNSKSAQSVLMEYAYKFDDVWFYSLVFTLISYMEDSNKDDTVLNLRTLRNLLEKENNLKRKNQTDKKGNIAINRAIGFLAIVGLIIVMIFLPDSQHFFFATIPGILCFVGGTLFLGITILINILMSKERK